MIEKISVPVSVILSFNHQTKQVVPKRVLWEGKVYKITKIGLHHTYREGRILYHIFSVAADSLFFRLAFNTDNLHWQLEEIAYDF